MRPVVLSIFGTRPEAIKFAPVIAAMGKRAELEVVNVVTSQHTDLLRPFIDLFGIEVHADLNVMRPNQQLNELLARVVSMLDEQIQRFRPALVLVQGDTTSALGGALAAFNRGVAVGHIEAGLRSGNPVSPFPEEMNRRLISQIAQLHFAATESNRANLSASGVADDQIHVTGNPVVDALQSIRADREPSAGLLDSLARLAGRRLIVLTTHRRENFGELMSGYLRALRDFVSADTSYGVIFPVHPNPAVRKVTQEVFEGLDNVMLLEPLGYVDFLHLISKSWIVVSDSGGIQEEAPSLGKALLVLRKDTERPEAITAGVSRLILSPQALTDALEEAKRPDSWINRVRSIPNPFGDGRAANRIADVVCDFVAEHNDT